MSTTPPLIEHLEALPLYVPPGHSGTQNRRLTDRAFCENFELVLGEVAPGGEAETHHHDREHQAMYVLAGQCTVMLGDDGPVICGPGTIIRIPPHLEHEVLNSGDVPLNLLIVYSPPLARR